MARPLREAAPARAALAAALAMLASAVSGPVPPARAAEAETLVRVERVKPHVEKHPTLRFLKENKDFLRAALDRTRLKAIEQEATAAAIDPRFLAYRELLAQAMATGDSLALADAERQRRELLASVTELGALESELDQLDRMLAAQRERLAVLQADFTGDQRTALAIVLSGVPKGMPLAMVGLTLDDGTVVSVPLSDDQRDALVKGGAVQIFHGYVEPREQVVQVTLVGAGDGAGDPSYISLEPARDRLTLLRLELSEVGAGAGAAGMHATMWLNDAQVP